MDLYINIREKFYIYCLLKKIPLPKNSTSEFSEALKFYMYKYTEFTSEKLILALFIETIQKYGSLSDLVFKKLSENISELISIPDLKNSLLIELDKTYQSFDLEINYIIEYEEYQKYKVRGEEREVQSFETEKGDKK